MKFEFEIPDDEFESDYGLDFKDTVTKLASEEIFMQVFGTEITGDFRSLCKEYAMSLLKKSDKKIIDSIVNRVASNIEHKKQIVDAMPKARELAAIDKDNEKYFSELIDKAIARRFGKA